MTLAFSIVLPLANNIVAIKSQSLMVAIPDPLTEFQRHWMYQSLWAGKASSRH
ncbi:hypothetical protein QPK13_01220 [Photorhabdus tasmaniensis]|uniref:hypothetical protein n=1 Tax=Photorhabdus sp. RM323S TaxID=3342828 RepID=UPI0036DA8E10